MIVAIKHFLPPVSCMCLHLFFAIEYRLTYPMPLDLWLQDNLNDFLGEDRQGTKSRSLQVIAYKCLSI